MNLYNGHDFSKHDGRKNLSVQPESCYDLDRFQIFHSGPPTTCTEYIVNCTLNAILAIAAILGNGMILHAIRKSAAFRPPSRALSYSLAASDFGVRLIVQPFYVLYKTAELKNNHLLYCICLRTCSPPFLF